MQMLSRVSEPIIISGWLADGFVLETERDGQCGWKTQEAKNYTLVVHPEDLSTEMQANGAWI